VVRKAPEYIKDAFLYLFEIISNLHNMWNISDMAA
jgi:hypothetical protein